MIFQGTRNSTIIPDEDGGIWEEFQFKCKPGDPKRRPCIISPYHYRLDWLMWFAAFQVSKKGLFLEIDTCTLVFVFFLFLLKYWHLSFMQKEILKIAH